MINRLDGAARTFRNVQGLRAIAALLVFSVHLNVPELRFLNPLGEWGVDLFFIISGFVMITSTWNEFATPAISARFFVRRLTRVYPAYWLVLLPIVVLYLIAPEMVNGSQAVRPSILASALLLPQTGKPLLTVSWTLVYEILFYVVFALVLAFKRRWCLTLVIGWGVLTLILGFALAPLHNRYAEVYADSIVLEFVLGVIAGYIVQTRAAPFPIASLAIGLIGIAVADRLYDPFNVAHHLGGSLRFACVGIPALFVFNGVVGLETRYGAIFPMLLQKIGNASYALYLWHVPISILLARASYGFLRRHPSPLVHALWLAAVVVIVIAASMLIYERVERPMLRFFAQLIRRREVRAQPPPAPAPAPVRAVPRTVESIARR